MNVDDIVLLLPHHLHIPPRGYVIEYPINSSERHSAWLGRFTRPQPNSLVNIAGAVVQQHFRNFFGRANYPDWHYNDFIHAQIVLKMTTMFRRKFPILICRRWIITSVGVMRAQT